ncbi:hypothetical protein ADIS_3441 [Lunatimonas lonarensis]|uniref:Uncharacterized protein n=1 Tax=Lunatimonas lonarensis TaxID=1232681 RepID=R7ZQI6_9BACT|nr:hypothetical protein ADIS_3441 [Lunatimonas lonarensis]
MILIYIYGLIRPFVLGYSLNLGCQNKGIAANYPSLSLHFFYLLL